LKCLSAKPRTVVCQSAVDGVGEADCASAADALEKMPAQTAAKTATKTVGFPCNTG
jgi:hypothetical protein